MKEELCTPRVIEALRAEGFDVGRSYLAFLVEARHFEPPRRVGHAMLWTADDIERLRGVLRLRGRWAPA